MEKLTRLLNEAELYMRGIDEFIGYVRKSLGDKYNVKAFIEPSETIAQILRKRAEDEDIDIHISVSTMV